VKDAWWVRFLDNTAEKFFPAANNLCILSGERAQGGRRRSGGWRKSERVTDKLVEKGRSTGQAKDRGNY